MGEQQRPQPNTWETSALAQLLRLRLEELYHGTDRPLHEEELRLAREVVRELEARAERAAESDAGLGG